MSCRLNSYSRRGRRGKKPGMKKKMPNLNSIEKGCLCIDINYNNFIIISSVLVVLCIHVVCM